MHEYEWNKMNVNSWIKWKFNKELETTERNQTEILELKKAVTKLKSSLENVNNKLNEKGIIELEDTIIQSKEQKNRGMKKSEECLQVLCDATK